MITVSLSPNEAMRPRAAKILAAIRADERFVEGQSEELPFDLRISMGKTECVEDSIGCQAFLKSEKVFHVELKDFSEDNGSDYLSSILNGHLYEQILAAREAHSPVAVVVIGDDNDVGAAIRKAASHDQGGHRVDPKKLMEYYRMVEGFEANCIALGVPVWRLKTDPYGRLLLRVRKILEGGDLTGFAPAPAEGERQAVGLSILAGRGIGPTKAGAILEKFMICLLPKRDDNFLVDCAGIGEKLAMQLFHSKTISVDCCHVCRPPKPRKSRAKAAKLAEVLG